MSEEEHRGWLPPKAPGASPPPHFDKNQPQPPAPPTPPPPPPPEERYVAPAPAEPAPQPPPGDAARYPAEPPPSWPLRDPVPPSHAQQPPPGALTPYQDAGRAPAQPAAGNGPAIAGFILAICGLVLFVLGGFGLLFILNLPCSILGWIFGVRGRRKLARGETRDHAPLARWAVGLGIAGTVIGAIAAIAWIVGLATSEELRDELEKQIEDASQSNVIRLVGALGPVAGAALRVGLG